MIQITIRHFISLLIIGCSIISCTGSTGNERRLQNRIDSLEKKLTTGYKPGFGEFMTNIQLHHAKLWFAGQNNNWELAGFEIHEIMESMDGIKQYQPERKETERIGMIGPAIDSVNTAIEQKDILKFRNSYRLLTSTCNNCHKAVSFEFNVVKIPDTPPFTNQSFSKPEAH